MTVSAARGSRLQQSGTSVYPSPPPPPVEERVPGEVGELTARPRLRSAVITLVLTRETSTVEPQGRSCGLMGDSVLCKRQEDNGVYVCLCVFETAQTQYTQALFVEPWQRQADLR